MQSTLLRVPKIVAILKLAFGRQYCWSITAARLMGKPLGGRSSSRREAKKVPMPRRAAALIVTIVVADEGPEG
jgi:hypothetical protein